MARFLGFGTSSTSLNLSTYTVIKSTCSGASGATSLAATGSFSAGDRLFICQMRGTGVGAYEDNTVASYTSGTITLVHPLENTYTDSGASQAQVVVVPQASAVTGSLTVPAWDGNVGGLFVVACSGTFSGTINAVGKGYRGGSAVYGAVGTVGSSGKQGEGYSAAQDGVSRNANTIGGGGGPMVVFEGGDGGNGGGGGGYATGGTTGGYGQQTNLASGGLTVGQADLATGIFMGGGGGSGGGESNDNEGPHIAGAGSAGGGIIVVYTKKISSGASLLSSGSTGGTGARMDLGPGSGGGGAGGTILLISTEVESPTITASGGTGGAASYTGGAGGNGGEGRVRILTCSLTGSSTPTASAVTGGHDFCSSLAYVY